MDPEKRPETVKFLTRYLSVSQRYDEFAERTDPVFFGYSIYEVDGAFVGAQAKPYEERSTLAKIVFKPDDEKLADDFEGRLTLRDVKVVAKKFFSTYLSRFRVFYPTSIQMHLKMN